MDETGHKELDGMMADLFDALYAQQELINKMNCKLALIQKKLNGLEAKHAQLKNCKKTHKPLPRTHRG